MLIHQTTTITITAMRYDSFVRYACSHTHTFILSLHTATQSKSEDKVVENSKMNNDILNDIMENVINPKQPSEPSVSLPTESASKSISASEPPASTKSVTVTALSESGTSSSVQIPQIKLCQHLYL